MDMKSLLQVLDNLSSTIDTTKKSEHPSQLSKYITLVEENNQKEKTLKQKEINKKAISIAKKIMIKEEVNNIDQYDYFLSDLMVALELATDAIRNPKLRKKYFDYLEKKRAQYGETYSIALHKGVKNAREHQKAHPLEHDRVNSLIEEEDEIDKISMDVPLFIRMLEYAREDAKNDVELHKITERMLTLSKNKDILSINDYDTIVGQTDGSKNTN